METFEKIEQQDRDAGISESTIIEMRRARNKIVSIYNDCMKEAENGGLISAETRMYYIDVAPPRGQYKQYPVIPMSAESFNKEGFISSFLSSNKNAFMKSFVETLEKPRTKGEFTPQKLFSVQQLMLFELPKIIVKDLFMPNEKNETTLNFLGDIKKRDGVRFSYLTQAYCVWLYGEIIKNKPEILDLTGVSVKDLEKFYFQIWNSNLFSYYLTYFESMFGKEGTSAHPRIVLTIYLREVLRIVTGSDIAADELIDAMENDMEKCLQITIEITLLGNLIIDAIKDKIGK